MVVSRESTLLLEAALSYARRGWPILPLWWPREDGDCACGSPECDSVGKHPMGTLVPHGVNDSTTDERRIRTWWAESPSANVGIATGHRSFFVVDVDARRGGLRQLAALEENEDPHGTGLVAQTGGGGLHLCFLWPGDADMNLPAHLMGPDGPFAGIDLQGNGKCIAAPPSLHKSGRRYAWQDEPEDLADLPAPGEFPWPEEYLGPSRSKPSPIPEEIQEGGRNITLFRFGASLRGKGFTEDEILASIQIANKSRCSSPLEEGELRKIAASAARYEPGDSATTAVNADDTQRADATSEQDPPRRGEHRFTDLGNARRMAEDHRGRARFCARLKRWFVWNGVAWREDETGEIRRLARETVKGIYRRASDCHDEDRRKKLVKWALSSEQRSKFESMIELAKSEPEIPVTVSELDQHPFLLATQNCVIDLRTGRPVDPDPSRLITKQAGVAFDPRARCPQWEKFLKQIMTTRDENDKERVDEDLVEFLQRAVGYCLTGSVEERCLFFLYGTGKNGKSTFLEVVRALLGEFAVKTPISALLLKRGETIPNDVARLRGVRFTYASEAPEGKALDENLIKDLSGREHLAARYLHAEWFDFEPRFKLWIGTNHRPLIKGTDDAIWDRVRLIPFRARFDGKSEDRSLVEKIKGQLAGVLNWAVEGCLAWQREGLRTPDTVVKASEEYRADMDYFADFLEECCDLEKGKLTNATSLYENWRVWCNQNGHFPGSQKRFSRRLVDRGFEKGRGPAGHVVYYGLKLTRPLAD